MGEQRHAPPQQQDGPEYQEHANTGNLERNCKLRRHGILSPE